MKDNLMIQPSGCFMDDKNDEKVRVIFSDAEAAGALVGFFDLAFKIHKRIHPELYQNNRKLQKI